ncbi:hypothetical protein ACFQHO_53655 [Actinomadura yumaensis]|uniref:hypothetical protein n=1 Tax=Actinomadura yumaensis TaxID=111807 RepID=UPI003616F70C
MAIMLASLLSVASSVSTTARADEPASLSQFVPLTPKVLLDTRNGTGTTGTAKVPAKGSITFQVAGQGGVPASGVSAVALNLTEIGTTKFGWFTVFPSDQPVTTSTLTYHPGENATGEDFTPLTSTGKVTIVNNSDSEVHAVVGVRGYFQNAADTHDDSEFYPVPAQYLYDTRPSLTAGSPARTTPLDANSSMTIDVAGRNGIPTTEANAVAVNVVATGQTERGWLAVYPSDQPNPKVATVDYVKGESDSSFTVTQLTSSGKLTVTNTGNSAVHVSITLRGYFKGGTTPGTGYKPVPTKIILDTLAAKTEPLAAGASSPLTLQQKRGSIRT